MYWAGLIIIILHTYHILCCHYNNYLRNNANIIHDDAIRQLPKPSLLLPWCSKGTQWLINLKILHLARANTRQYGWIILKSQIFYDTLITQSCMNRVLTILTRLTILGNNLQANILHYCTGEGILVWRLFCLCLENMSEILDLLFCQGLSIFNSSSSISWEMVYQEFVSKYWAILSKVRCCIVSFHTSWNNINFVIHVYFQGCGFWNESHIPPNSFRSYF